MNRLSDSRAVTVAVGPGSDGAGDCGIAKGLSVVTVIDAIGAYTSVLERFGTVVDFDISGLDRTGVAVTSCSLAVDGRFRHHGNGYGRTAEAARLGGLGELAEGVLAATGLEQARARSVRGSAAELISRYGAESVVDPRRLCLPAGSAYSAAMELPWCPVRRVRTGETVWIPLDFVASEPGDVPGQPLIPPVTNGLGAGLDVPRALAHAILEILQRHTNGLRIRALDRLSPAIDPASLPASVGAVVEDLLRVGIEPVLKHAGTAYGICSTYVGGLDPRPAEPIMHTGCGEAAHPDAEVSLTKAILEYANSRARKAFCFGDLDRARAIAPRDYWSGLDLAEGEPRARQALQAWRDRPAASLAALTAPDRTHTVRYSDITVPALPDLPDSSRLVDHLLGALSEHDVLALTTEVGGVVAAKVVITELSVETLSYGRIGAHGVRESLDHDLDLVRFSPEPVGEHAARVCLPPEVEEDLGAPAWYSYAAAQRLVGPLYPLYREPPRHTVAW